MNVTKEFVTELKEEHTIKTDDTKWDMVFKASFQ